MLEQQDLGQQGRGFYATDFKCRLLSKGDYSSLWELKKIAQKIDEKSDFIEKLSRANSPYAIEMLYKDNGEAMREFAREQRKIEPASDLVKLPDDNFFDNLDLNLELEGIINWIIRDGGEIRGPFQAYSRDRSVREGWTRLCWK